MTAPHLKLVTPEPRPTGPTQRFLALTRKPDLASPTRFEPTEKGPHDVVI